MATITQTRVSDTAFATDVTGAHVPSVVVACHAVKMSLRVCVVNLSVEPQGGRVWVSFDQGDIEGDWEALCTRPETAVEFYMQGHRLTADRSAAYVSAFEYSHLPVRPGIAGSVTLLLDKPAAQRALDRLTILLTGQGSPRPRTLTGVVEYLFFDPKAGKDGLLEVFVRGAQGPCGWSSRPSACAKACPSPPAPG